MNIAVVWWFEKSSQIFENWRDGHRAAFEEIGKKHTIKWFLDKTYPDIDEPLDFIILWDDSNSTFFDLIDKYQCKKGLCLTTMPSNIDNLHKVDVVFCESEPVLREVRSHNVYAVKAFGTDTDFFKPDIKVKKDIPFFYPATFSPWKRQDELADLGSDLYLVGTIQPDGLDIYQRCANRGCIIETGYFPATKIRKMYQRAERVVIPAIHGSERTCLEAMATDILPTITHPEHDKLYSYVKEYNISGIKSPREFVLKFYSHKVFANSLMRGINEVLNKNENSDARMGN